MEELLLVGNKELIREQWLKCLEWDYGEWRRGQYISTFFFSSFLKILGSGRWENSIMLVGLYWNKKYQNVCQYPWILFIKGEHQLKSMIYILGNLSIYDFMARY